MPNVKGRIDHMDVDVKGKQLVVAGLENGSLEVVDLKGGKWIKSVPGFQKPQGIAYVESLNKVFVASGDDGMLRCQTLGEQSLSHPTVCSSGPSLGFQVFPATRCQGKTVSGSGLGLIQNLTEKVLATGPRMIYVLPEPARTCWRLTRTSPYSPASNRRNPVVPEVDGPELSS